MLDTVREVTLHVALSLTVEPTKLRLCHSARYVNLLMRDLPFQLDKLAHLKRYLPKDSFQTTIDDKSFSNFNDVNKAWKTWKEIILDIANQHAPLQQTRVKSENSPWMTNEIHHRVVTEII